LHSLKAGIIASIIAFGPIGAALALETSPIFGTASIQATTPSENKGIVGKGQIGEIYAYYGSYYAGLAQQYGSLGQYYGYVSNGGGTNYGFAPLCLRVKCNFINRPNREFRRLSIPRG
jgi:hypothetical protein